MADPNEHPVSAEGRRTSEATSLSLVRRVRIRDPQAWQQLVDLYGPKVYGWCRCEGLAAHDAADVVQDVFTAVAAGIDTFRGEGPCGSFRAWLRTITHHKAADFRRRRGLAEAEGGTTAYGAMLQVAEPADVSSSHVVENEASFWRSALELVRAEFEPQTWQAFWRTAVDGQAPADVARELQTSVAAVYQAKCRVLRRLRQEIDEP